MIPGLQEIYWISWHWLGYVLLYVGAVIVIMVYQLYKRYRAVTRLTGQGNQGILLIGFSWIIESLRFLFTISALTLFAIALLRPAWGRDESTEIIRGREVYIALDVSKSMRAQDIQPSRLEAAKQKMIALLSQLQCDRVGLILFSGSAFVQCPLTTDYGTLRMFLEQVDVESIASGTTALDKAIIISTQAFKRSGSSAGSKLLIICTDGEDFSTGALAAAQQAAQAGIHIITLGLASSEGAPIPLSDHVSGSGYQKNEQGAIVISRLDESLLTKLAQNTGGFFVRAADRSNADVKEIKQAIEHFEKEQLDSDTTIGFIERYWPFVVAGFGALIMRWLL